LGEIRESKVMAKKDGINIPVGVDTRPLQSGMEQAAAIVQSGGDQMAAAITSTSTKSSTSLKSLQQAYRATYKDAQLLAQQQGANSQAFQEAATAAAKYKDELEDVQDAIKAASPEQKWKLVGSVIQGAVDIAQGFVGVMSLIGIESNTAEKAIQAMMSLSAISGAISGVFQLADSYKALSASIGTATIASNTLWASMLKPLKYAAGILAAIVATIGTAGKGSALREGFNFKPEDIKFKGDKTNDLKPTKLKEAKSELTTYADAFNTTTIAIKKTQLAVGSLSTTAPKQISAMVQSSGESLNKIGVFFDELGAKIGGWSELATAALVNMSASLGEALVTGGFKEAGEAIVKQLGSIAIQIGAAMVAIGIPQAAVGLPSGFAYIAGGVALGVLGGAMQASGQAPGSSAGGSVGGGNSQMSSSYIQPSFSGTQYLMLDGKVRGQDLVIATSNTRRDNRR